MAMNERDVRPADSGGESLRAMPARPGDVALYVSGTQLKYVR